MVVQYLLLFGSFVVLVLGVLVVAVYWDAKQSGMDSPKKWTVFVFFTGSLGIVAYISEHDREVQDHDPNPRSLPGAPLKTSGDDDQS